MDLENNLEVAIIVAVVLVFMMWVVDKLKDIKSAITAEEFGRLNVLIRSESNWRLVERLEGFRFIPRVGDIIVQGVYRLPVTQIEFLRDGRFTTWTEVTVEDLEHVDSALVHFLKCIQHRNWCGEKSRSFKIYLTPKLLLRVN